MPSLPDTKVVRYTRLENRGEKALVFHVERGGASYLLKMRKGSGLEYGIESRGSKSQIKAAMDRLLANLAANVTGYGDSFEVTSTRLDAEAERALAVFDHPTFGVDWDKGSAEPVSDAQDFHKLLERQLKDWVGSPRGLAFANHSYYPTFKGMVEDEVGRVTVYRGVYGDIARDVIDGGDLPMRRYSSWTLNKRFAKEFVLTTPGGASGGRGSDWVTVRATFPASAVVMAPVALPDYAPDPNILLSLSSEDEVVIESTTDLRAGSFRVIEKTRRKRRAERVDVPTEYQKDRTSALADAWDPASDLAGVRRNERHKKRHPGFNCDKYVSAAWVDSRGKVVDLGGSSHTDFAQNWLGRREPELLARLMKGIRSGDLRMHWNPLINSMVDAGWVQVMSMREIAVGSSPTAKSMWAVAGILADCLDEKGGDPEAYQITIWSGTGSKQFWRNDTKMSLGDFIHRYGDSSMEEGLYDSLMDRMASRVASRYASRTPSE